MRYVDWEEKLNDYLAEQNGKAFEWGDFDCVRFSMGAVKAMTGVDHTEGLQWSNEAEAKALLDEQSLEDRLAEKFERVPPMFARRGDVAMFEGACGIVAGRLAYFVGDPWRAVPLDKLEAAFRV